MKTSHLITAFLLLTTSVFGARFSSERPPRASQTPGGTRATSAPRFNPEKYSAGKAVFTGKAPLKKNARATKTQRARLEIVVVRSRAERADATRLRALAGKLSEDQLDALEYYVAQRHSRRR